jgi:HrpA-like RNA helicase
VKLVHIFSGFFPRVFFSRIYLCFPGKQMAMFPLSPAYSKVLILSKQFRCSQEVLKIIAMLSTENVISTPSSSFLANSAESENSAVPETQKNLATFFSPDGDHIFFLRIFDAYVNEKGKKKNWCLKYSINYKAMKQVSSKSLAPNFFFRPRILSAQIFSKLFF